MSKRLIIVGAVLSFFLNVACACAQQTSLPKYCVELHFASQGSFGPSNSQVEIVGGMDTMFYDNKKHISPGFKSSSVIEVTAGYHKNKFQLQSTIGYFEKDIGLVQKFSSNEYQFVDAEMLSVKVSALLQWSNKVNPEPYGFFTGFFIGSVFPVSYKINNRTTSLFEIEDIIPSAQFCWGIDFNYRIKFADKGWYAIVGITGTMPGLVGGIGNIELQPNSSYTIERDKIKMYYFSGLLGIGKCLGK